MLAEINAINSIACNLDKFKWLQPNKVANCRCPICGDSKTNKRKARGYFVWFKETFFYKCHKCGASLSLSSFLKEHFNAHHQQFRLEKLKEQYGDVAPIAKALEETPLESIKTASTAISIADLPDTHIARKYVQNRCIPTDRYDEIGYVENFSEYVQEMTNSAKYKRLPKDKRIVLELRDERGNLFGMQGRALVESSAVKYITIKLDDSKPKIFGLDTVNTSLPVIVTEGAIDSMFIDNSIAICGGDVSLSLSFLQGKSVIVALDNEPRHRDTVVRMEKAIEMGYGVCFWRIDPKFKDINDMILNGGYTKEYIHDHIVKNSYSGARAKVALALWKKI